jgi:signal transduction histidine kinase
LTLAGRIWIYGALVPVVALLAATFVGARFFRSALERRVDDALLSQAAVESGSLFDDIEPHLHLTRSPIQDRVRKIAPSAAIFGPDGKATFRYPTLDGSLTDTYLDVSSLSEHADLLTRRGPDGERVRVVNLAVIDPGGTRYGLQLAASLAAADASYVAFLRAGLLVTFGVGLFLVVTQGLVARRLARRVGALSQHMAALREGNLDSSPPPDNESDELHELSRLVAEATAKLRHARAAQERLIAEAAHELRTPLQLMKTSLDLDFRRTGGDRAELERALADIRAEVDRLARLATRLLDLAAAGRGRWDRTPGDVAAVAREAAEAIRAEAETHGVLVEVDAPEPVPALFDANGIRQAIDNLLSNALKFGPERGVVRVLVRRSQGVARVLVHDDGPGIGADERERVFEPFVRGKERSLASGAGLGLAIVREVARGHGGRAYVAEGEGGNVVLELPARDQPSRAA